MIRNTFDLCLHKVAGGDNSYLGRLCEMLAEKRLAVPINPSIGNLQDPSTKLNVLLVPGIFYFLVPVFTFESLFNRWLEQHKYNCNCVLIRGSDLCARIDENIGIGLNLGNFNQVILDPAAVAITASHKSFQAKEDGDEGVEETNYSSRIQTISCVKSPVVTLLEKEGEEGSSVIPTSRSTLS